VITVQGRTFKFKEAVLTANEAKQAPKKEIENERYKEL